MMTSAKIGACSLGQTRRNDQLKQPTTKRTDMRGHREVTLPMMKKKYIFHLVRNTF